MYHGLEMQLPSREELLENGDITQDEYDIDVWLDGYERSQEPPE